MRAVMGQEKTGKQPRAGGRDRAGNRGMVYSGWARMEMGSQEGTRRIAKDGEKVY